MFDFFHHTESLSAFTLSGVWWWGYHREGAARRSTELTAPPRPHAGLADAADPAFAARTARFAAMYMGDDPEAPNYDKVCFLSPLVELCSRAGY
jgi:hypothetical protein